MEVARPVTRLPFSLISIGQITTLHQYAMISIILKIVWLISLSPLLMKIAKYLLLCMKLRDYCTVSNLVHQASITLLAKPLDLPPHAINWMISYLSSRSQILKCDGQLSANAEINTSIVRVGLITAGHRRTPQDNRRTLQNNRLTTARSIQNPKCRRNIEMY